MSKALENLIGGNVIGSTGSDTSYVNKVFLGSTPVVKGKNVMSPTGVQYTQAARGGDITKSAADAKKDFFSWDDKTLNGFINRLGSYGFKNVSRITAKSMWDMAVDGASTWYAGSNGMQKITPEQYLQWYSKGQAGSGGSGNLPQKQVYLYDNATIKGLIDDTLNNVLGRKATSDENKQFFTKLKQMMNEGTVTTTEQKIVGGKKMNVSTTKPGFSKEAAAFEIEKQIKSGTAGQQEDYLQKKSLDFADFLSQLGG
jgi:hypothetical protein